MKVVVKQRIVWCCLSLLLWSNQHFKVCTFYVCAHAFNRHRNVPKHFNFSFIVQVLDFRKKKVNCNPLCFRLPLIHKTCNDIVENLIIWLFELSVKTLKYATFQYSAPVCISIAYRILMVFNIQVENILIFTKLLLSLHFYSACIL